MAKSKDARSIIARQVPRHGEKSIAIAEDAPALLNQPQYLRLQQVFPGTRRPSPNSCFSAGFCSADPSLLPRFRHREEGNLQPCQPRPQLVCRRGSGGFTRRFGQGALSPRPGSDGSRTPPVIAFRWVAPRIRLRVLCGQHGGGSSSDVRRGTRRAGSRPPSCSLMRRGPAIKPVRGGRR
jgi:hypothetical protein